jgi:hypothetical protein
MTKTDNDLSRPKPKPYWKRRSVKIITGLVIFFVILFQIILPVGIRLYLEKWLVENGAETAVIEKLQINPFTGVAAL